MMLNKRFLSLFAAFIILVLFPLSGCKDSESKDAVSSSESMSGTVSEKADVNTDISASSDLDYSSLREVNEEYDDNGNVILANVYNDDSDIIVYRKYSYNKDNSLSDMKTYNADDSLKSTVYYKYSSSGDKNSITIRLTDESDKTVFSNYYEYVYDTDSEEYTTYDSYSDENDALIYYVTYEYDEYFIRTGATYFDSKNQEIAKETADNRRENIENLLYNYLY